MPNLPHPHRMVAVWTQPRIATCTLTVAFPGGLDTEDLDRILEQALHLRERLTNPSLDLCKRLCCLHPIVPDAFEPFGKHLVHLCGEVNYVARMTQMTILP